MADTPSSPPDDMDAKDMWDKYLRAMADNENMRKRHRAELEQAREQGAASTLLDMLPIVDDLQRGNAFAQAARGRGSLGKIREGFGRVAAKAQQTLRTIGVEEFTTEKQAFDPRRMEAVARTTTPTIEPGKVAGEVSRGYTRKGKLLRAAKVVVATEPEIEKEPS